MSVEGVPSACAICWLMASNRSMPEDGVGPWEDFMVALTAILSWNCKELVVLCRHVRSWTRKSSWLFQAWVSPLVETATTEQRRVCKSAPVAVWQLGTRSRVSSQNIVREV